VAAVPRMAVAEVAAALTVEAAVTAVATTDSRFGTQNSTPRGPASSGPLRFSQLRM
jgi:hypothetical protein